MRRVVWGVVPVLMVVVLLAGCQGKSGTGSVDIPKQYDSAAQIRDALNGAGLGCADFQTIGRDSRDIGEKDAQEVATCRVENIGVTMMTWLRLGEAQDWARSRQAMGCQFAESLDTGSPVYVDGGRWIIALKSRPVATKIADAIGGEAKFPDCRG